MRSKIQQVRPGCELPSFHPLHGKPALGRCEISTHTQPMACSSKQCSPTSRHLSIYIVLLPRRLAALCQIVLQEHRWPAPPSSAADDTKEVLSLEVQLLQAVDVLSVLLHPIVLTRPEQKMQFLRIMVCLLILAPGLLSKNTSRTKTLLYQTTSNRFLALRSLTTELLVASLLKGPATGPLGDIVPRRDDPQ